MTNERGTLTNIKTGLVLTGVMTGEYPDYLDFRIDGTSESNIFMQMDWTFKGEGPALPTEYGYYGIYRTRDGGKHDSPFGYRIFRFHGIWTELTGMTSTESVEKLILDEGWELRRLTWENPDD